MNKYYEELVDSMSTSSTSPGRSGGMASIFKNHSEKLGLITGIDMLGSVVARLNGRVCYLNSGYKRKVLITAKQDSLGNGSIDRTVRGKYQGAGLDSKSGILSLCMLIEYSIKSDIYDDLYFVASSLDSHNYSGSFVCAEKINPTIFINIGTISTRKKASLGKGPVIIDSPSSNSKLVQILLEQATKNKIPYNIKTVALEETRICSRLVEAAGGIACCEVCIPGVFDAGSGIWSISKKDIENSARLIHKLVLEINKVDNLLPEV